MEQSSPDEVTRLLEEARGGNRDALNKLFPLVYKELHVQAQRQRQQWYGNQTVNTTAIVHEAYLKLVDQAHIEWNSRAHFLAVAAKAMRHILIDYAKRSRTQKRGGEQSRIPLQDITNKVGTLPEIQLNEDRTEELILLDEALNKLALVNVRQCQVVVCRFFGGMSIADTAMILDVSTATVKRDWMVAQAWLFREIKQSRNRF